MNIDSTEDKWRRSIRYRIDNLKDNSEKNNLKYFNGDELAAKVYQDKYENDDDSYSKDSSPLDMHIRIAKALYGIENKYPNPTPLKKIVQLLHKFKYLVPGGSIMYGLNNPEVLSVLGNCFVIGHHQEKDSYGAIMRRDEELVQLAKRRGGVGQDLSFIRAAGAPVNNAAKTSTGVVPFAERYSRSTQEVGQGGRRGASMLTLDFDHGDIDYFIDAKANTSNLTGANISIKVRDYQMKSIIGHFEGKDIKPNNGYEVFEEDAYVSPKFLANSFKKLIKNARNFSEPGLLFWDRINEQIDSAYYHKFKPITTNPC